MSIEAGIYAQLKENILQHEQKLNNLQQKQVQYAEKLQIQFTSEIGKFPISENLTCSRSGGWHHP